MRMRRPLGCQLLLQSETVQTLLKQAAERSLQNY